MSAIALDMFHPEAGWDDFYPLNSRFLSSSPPYASHRSHHREDSEDDARLKPSRTVPRRRRRKPSRRHRTPKRAGFNDLPGDVLHILARYLDTPSRLCLSLVNRECYYFFFANGVGCTLPHQRERLLIMHERDRHAKQHYYCFPCSKLHPLTSECAPSPKLADNKVLKCDGDDYFCPMRNQYPLSWTHARLVMNAHIYGPNFGLPLSSICQPYTVACGPSTLLCETEAKIRDLRLLLRRTYTFTVPYERMEQFQEALVRNKFRLCSHTKLITPPPERQSNHRHEESVTLHKREPSWYHFRAMIYNEQVEGSCEMCATDYTCRAIPCTDAQGRAAWKIIAYVYHMLGSCRSPDAWKWSRFAERPSRGTRESRLIRKSTSMKNGDVLDEWFADEPGGDKYKPVTKETTDEKPQKKSKRHSRSRHRKRMTEEKDDSKDNAEYLRGMDNIPLRERPRRRYKYEKFAESDWKPSDPNVQCFLFLCVIALYILIIHHIYMFFGFHSDGMNEVVHPHNETFWMEHVLQHPREEL
ncbi:hypothetical protein VHEMI03368 [[Torrubiella] hemipterigena]|uniref:F-box domain-containing protein n=1 Tax=[Torrubiella] hemipterigena TaxID=1531966 RepID=A0A0A1TAY9_9HYPO|nr:hypothetical protein VHEMI03368 [[Torrubiella] hemipterigena]